MVLGGAKCPRTEGGSPPWAQSRVPMQNGPPSAVKIALAKSCENQANEDRRAAIAIAQTGGPAETLHQEPCDGSDRTGQELARTRGRRQSGAHRCADNPQAKTQSKTQSAPLQGRR